MSAAVTRQTQRFDLPTMQALEAYKVALNAEHAAHRAIVGLHSWTEERRLRKIWFDAKARLERAKKDLDSTLLEAV